MKPIIPAVLALSLTLGLPSEGKKDYAEINFKESTKDLGRITLDSVYEAFYHFSNNGNVPLLINSVTTDCGCISFQMPKHGILPGDSDTIKVKFNGEGRKNGKFMKIIKVRSNSNPSLSRIYLKGDVVTDKMLPENKKTSSISFKKTYSDLGTFRIDKTVKTSFVFTNCGQKPLTVLNVITGCKCTKAELTKSQLNPGDTDSIIVTYNGKYQKTGPFTKKLKVITDAETPLVNLLIKGETIEG